MQKPDVDHIEGLSPAISIEQKTTSRKPALHRRHRHRDLRLPAPAVRARRRAAIRRPPACRPRKPDRHPDGRPASLSCPRKAPGFMLLAPIVKPAARASTSARTSPELMKKGFQRVKHQRRGSTRLDQTPQARQEVQAQISTSIVDRLVVQARISPPASPTRSKPRSNWPTALRIAEFADKELPQSATKGANKSKNDTHELHRVLGHALPATVSGLSRIDRSRAADCSPSTHPPAPARSATASAPSCISKPTLVVQCDGNLSLRQAARSSRGPRPVPPRPITNRRCRALARHFKVKTSTTPWATSCRRCSRTPSCSAAAAMKISFVYETRRACRKFKKQASASKASSTNIERRWRETESASGCAMSFRAIRAIIQACEECGGYAPQAAAGRYCASRSSTNTRPEVCDHVDPPGRRLVRRATANLHQAAGAQRSPRPASSRKSTNA